MSKSKDKNTVEAIKRRLIYNASKMWGYSETQDINSFDPIVGLLFGAIADELSAVSSEIKETESRIVDKLLDILFNNNTYSHMPSHGIMTLQPIVSKLEINEKHQFFYPKRIKSADDSTAEEVKKIYFSPSSDQLLIDASVKYLITSTAIYEFDGYGKQKLPISAECFTSNDSNSIYIGIQANPVIDKLDYLSFYFSFKNIRSGHTFFSMLKSGQWKQGGCLINSEFGLKDNESINHDLFSELSNKKSSVSFKSCQQVEDFYKQSFVTLLDLNLSLKDSTNNNSSFLFSESYKEELELNDVVWLELSLPQPLHEDVLDDLIVSINCFPVLNRQLRKIGFFSLKGENITVLESDDLFLDVEHVSDSSGSEYVQRNSAQSQSEGLKTFVLKQGGVGRFESRDAQQGIKDLSIQIRNEAAAFKALGGDLINYELKQIDQIISRINQRLGDKIKDTSACTYLLLDSDSNNQKIDIEYWTTNGTIANKIRPGSKLQSLNIYDIKKDSMFFKTRTVGGREKLSQEEKMNSLRRELLSNGKVVTKADIRTLCYEIYGSCLKDVIIEKGVYQHPNVQKGICHCLNINLSISDLTNTEEQNRLHLAKQLLNMLENNSLTLLTYRIFINGKLIEQTC